MSFWTMFGEQLWAARTPIVIIAYVVTRALVRLSPQLERYHMRAALTLVIGHVIALAISTAQIVTGYEGVIAGLVSYAFELLAIIAIGITALFRTLLPRVGLRLPRILIDILTGIGVIVVFIAVGRRAGFSVAGLITTSAVLTAVIGFALQDTLGNIMGGLSLQLDKSIAVGDWVSLGPGEPAGRVSEVRWRYTAIEMRTWDTVIVPNGTLAKSKVTILGRSTGQPAWTRRQVDFYIDFRTSPTDVIEAIETTLRKDPPANVALDPAPHALLLNIKESVAHYAVRYWLTDLVPDEPTDSDVRIRVWFALRRANISLAIPASTIFLTPESPERDARKADREVDQRLRALKRVDLFSGLTVKLQRALADQLEFMPFAAGEAVTREGDKDDGLFMIVEGSAVVRIGQGREHKDVARLGPGQFFGEMSLMTGEARTASVIATTDLLCYRMNKGAFQQILEETPTIADQVAEVLAKRKTALSAAQNERDEARRKKDVESEKQDLLGRIRGFFGLDASQ